MSASRSYVFWLKSNVSDYGPSSMCFLLLGDTYAQSVTAPSCTRAAPGKPQDSLRTLGRQTLSGHVKISPLPLLFVLLDTIVTRHFNNQLPLLWCWRWGAGYSVLQLRELGETMSLKHLCSCYIVGTHQTLSMSCCCCFYYYF